MNPLLEKFETPFHTAPFDKIKNEHFLPAVQAAISEARAEIENIKEVQEPDFSNIIEALDRSGERLNIVASIFSTSILQKPMMKSKNWQGIFHP
ncbi:hypothetical protein [Echinicola jeungdonensis]|uniref:hypothetical protein n=1 Tax=Echinicola jeungdonensis TaxID=709343 RepID=UPI00339054D3